MMTDPGYWTAWGDHLDRVFIVSDGPREAVLKMTGDFSDVEDALDYARQIAKALNGEISPVA